MPNLSERQSLLRNLENLLELQVLESSSTRNTTSEENEDDGASSSRSRLRSTDEDWIVMYGSFCSNRYLYERSQVARATEKTTWLLEQLDDNRFKQEIRMSRCSFFSLVRLTEGHSIFSNQSNHSQRPPCE